MFAFGRMVWFFLIELTDGQNPIAIEWFNDEWLRLATELMNIPMEYLFFSETHKRTLKTRFKLLSNGKTSQRRLNHFQTESPEWKLKIKLIAVGVSLNEAIVHESNRCQEIDITLSAVSHIWISCIWILEFDTDFDDYYNTTLKWEKPIINDNFGVINSIHSIAIDKYEQRWI